MSQEPTTLDELVAHLTHGWPERIEYALRVQGVVERRVESRWQRGLWAQLEASKVHVPATGPSDGTGGGKPKSKPPGNLMAPDEIQWRIALIAAETLASWLSVDVDYRLTRTCSDLVRLSELSDQRSVDEVRDLEHSLRRVVHMARVNLGYDSETITFADTVCDDCGGALAVGRDLPASVRCIGSPATPPCGRTYPPETWADILAAGPCLVDTATALAAIGRPSGTLYRWASKGKVKRYGSPRKGQARWDIDELRKYSETLAKRGSPVRS